MKSLLILGDAGMLGVMRGIRCRLEILLPPFVRAVAVEYCLFQVVDAVNTMREQTPALRLDWMLPCVLDSVMKYAFHALEMSGMVKRPRCAILNVKHTVWGPSGC